MKSMTSILGRIFVLLLVCVLVFPGIASAAVVEKGNTISFSKSAITNGDTVTIQWQQDLKDRSADYIVVDAAFKENDVPLFVQKSKSDDLLAKVQGDETTLKVPVDSSFQYGQNKDKTFRFLVYHNKTNKPYQHRFINQTTAAKLAAAAKQLTGKVDISAVKAFNSFVSGAQAYFGDPLRDFI
jgi:hypothetical protein